MKCGVLGLDTSFQNICFGHAFSNFKIAKGKRESNKTYLVGF
jgi:hypothetical protein